MRYKLGVPVVCLALAPGLSSACALSLELPGTLHWRGELSRGYDAFASARHLEPLPVTVQHRGSACDYAVTFTAEEMSAALRQGSAELGYQVLSGPSAGRSLVQINGMDAQTAVLQSRFPHQNELERPNTAEHVTYVTVAPGQVVRGGWYAGRLAVRLFERKSNGHAVLKDQRSIDLSAFVVPRIDTVVGGGEFGTGSRHAWLHLGKLQADVEAGGSVDFRVRSNMHYGFSLRSANRGRLRHEKGLQGVPYRVRINGHPTRVEDDINALGGPTDVNGDAYTLDVSVLPPPRALLAGTYRDVLTVTFTTLE
jgi:hypothetical protein